MNTKKQSTAHQHNNILLHCKHLGEGEPVIFLHGVWMSSNFFKLQEEYFSKKYDYYAIDFRGHGKSTDNGSGHTIKTYATDLNDFITKHNLKNVNLVGWSMGAFVIWQYLKNFGADNIKTVTVVDQGPIDLKHSESDIAPLDLPGLVHFMELTQENQEEALNALMPLMFKESLPESELAWMKEEAMKMSPNSAACILFSQSMVDFREDLKDFDVPALLIFGADEKLLQTENGKFIAERMPNSKLVIFEESGHCPFLEEPNKFNQTVDEFIQNQSS